MIEIEVRQFGQFLATRRRAGEIRTMVEQILIDEPGDLVVLDFTDVEAITGGFADELVAHLRQNHGDRVRAANANTFVAETIATAVTRRVGEST